MRIACVALLLGAGAGEAAETVQFTSAVAPPTRFQSRLAAMRGIAPRQRAPDQLSGTLYRPVNGERTPAIVVLHTCDGPGPAEADWASRLAESGYIVLVVDSYGPRGVVETCTRLPAPNVGPQVFDAYGALAWLRRQPSVDADRVAVMGRAHGATSALDAVLARGTSTFFEERFAAVVALHPYCPDPIRRAFLAPVLILSGERDDLAPAKRCRRIAAEDRTGGDAITFVAYPSAAHAFDDPTQGAAHRVADIVNIERSPARGATFGYDAAAHRDAVARVCAFLDARQR